MPELPEVETVVRGLRKKVLGKKVLLVNLLRPSLLEDESLRNFGRVLKNQQLNDINRRGKFIIIGFSKGHTLVTHLRMTGKYLVFDKKHPPDKQTRMIIEFTDGAALHYSDQRALGRLCLLRPGQKHKSVEKLGPDPFGPDFSVALFSEKLTGVNRELKDALMDQKLVAGIGNIYASEICFQAGISPFRRTTELNAKELRALHRLTIKILGKAIELNGTTFSDFRDVENSTGNFQKFLKVYGKNGAPCPRCKKEIVRAKQKQRSTYHCPTCQK
jgi:formamidopyrimidine-DNA glycosylase